MSNQPQWPEDYKDWTGSIEDLVQEAARILNQIDPKLGSPTTSLVRYYQQQGAVGRGKKKGRSSTFGYEDLARVVATKQLASQQVPLSLSKHVFSNTPVDSIVRSAGVPDTYYGSPAAAASVALSNKTHSVNDAERTVAQLLSGANYAERSFAGNQGHMGGSMQAKFAAHTAAAAMTPTANTIISAGPAKALPAGGVLRYALAADVAVEIPADTQDRSAQAQALREFANQIDPSFQSPTWRIP